MSNGTSAPIQWQSEMLWVGPTYPGGMYYYISFPGPDANNPSYQASKQVPADPSGLPAPPNMIYGPWVPVNITPVITSTLRYRLINNGAAWQLDGSLTYGPGLQVGAAAQIGTLPSVLVDGMNLPQNSLIMTNSGLTRGWSYFEILASPAGNIQLTPQVNTLISCTIQQVYALNTPAPVGGLTILGSYPTLVAAMAACQNDINPPIPAALHVQLGY